MIIIHNGKVQMSTLKDERKGNKEAETVVEAVCFADLGCHLEALKLEFGAPTAIKMITKAIAIAFEEELKGENKQ